MRIIAGQAGGIPLRVPRSVARPTTDRVREALFASLGDLIPDSTILDLYAGSGSLGLEALSRGATHVTFVDQSREACKVIQSNLQKAGFAREVANVRSSPVENYLRHQARISAGVVDLVLADPPYRKSPDDPDFTEKVVQSEDLAACVRENGWLVLETAHPAPEPETELWEVRDHRHYGTTGIWFLQKV